jgi:hypothetical protein
VAANAGALFTGWGRVALPARRVCDLLLRRFSIHGTRSYVFAAVGMELPTPGIPRGRWSLVRPREVEFSERATAGDLGGRRGRPDLCRAADPEHVSTRSSHCRVAQPESDDRGCVDLRRSLRDHGRAVADRPPTEGADVLDCVSVRQDTLSVRGSRSLLVGDP